MDKTVWKERIHRWLVRLHFVSGLVDWAERLLAILARPTLLACVAYAAYKSVNHQYSNMLFDSIYLIAQVVAFEVAAPGLNTMADEAEFEGNEKRAARLRHTAKVGQWLGIATLVELAIVHLNIIPGVTPFLSQGMLVARGAASIFFLSATGHKRGEDGQAVPPVKAPDILAQLAALGETIEQRLTQIERHVETVVAQKTQAIDESVKAFTGFQQQQISSMSESLSTVETGLQEYIDERLSPILSNLEVLSILPSLNEQLGQTTRLVTEEITRVVEVTLKQHSQHSMSASRLVEGGTTASKRQLPGKNQAARLRLPSATPKEESHSASEAAGRVVRSGSGDDDFDRKQFVYACLEENEEMTIKEIQDRANEMGKTISIGCISGHRKTFFETVKARGMKGAESDVVVTETTPDESTEPIVVESEM